MTDRQPLFLGVDAGGSHTRARLIDAAGQVLGEAETGPANARIGIDRLEAALIDVAGMTLRQAGLSADALTSVAAGFGIAGVTRVGVREALDAWQLPFRHARFDTDAAIAQAGAHGGRDGAILILGTGSIGYARVGGESFTVGGYGFPISDEGSGAALGLSAVRHALRALDGRTRRTALGAAVIDAFGDSTQAAVAWMDRATPRDYAAFAPLVMDYAEADDTIARSIVEDAALHVERFIETIFERGAPACALMGGLAGRMQRWLRARTVERLVAPEGDALDGALLLAGYRPA